MQQEIVQLRTQASRPLGVAGGWIVRAALFLGEARGRVPQQTTMQKNNTCLWGLYIYI